MRILLCDDHKIVRDGLRYMISSIDCITLIKDAGTGNEVLELLKKESFDILLLDISLPDRSGLEILEIVKVKWPSTKVLMLSMHSQDQYAIRALKLGASGYLGKDVASEELIHAVRKLIAGGTYVSESFAESLANHFYTPQKKQKHTILSNREFEIMIQLANGKSLKEIGNMLFISNKTVSTHRRRILDKMELDKNTELVRYCIENKLI